MRLLGVRSHATLEHLHTFEATAKLSLEMYVVYRMEEYCLHAADVVLCPSAEWAQVIRPRYDIPAERILISPPSIEYTRMTFRAPLAGERLSHRDPLRAICSSARAWTRSSTGAGLLADPAVNPEPEGRPDRGRYAKAPRSAARRRSSRSASRTSCSAASSSPDKCRGRVWASCSAERLFGVVPGGRVIRLRRPRTSCRRHSAHPERYPYLLAC